MGKSIKCSDKWLSEIKHTSRSVGMASCSVSQNGCLTLPIAPVAKSQIPFIAMSMPYVSYLACLVGATAFHKVTSLLIKQGEPMETPNQKWRQTDLFTTLSFYKLSPNKREVISKLLAQMMKEIIQNNRNTTGENNHDQHHN